jgi:hypothetical protein
MDPRNTGGASSHAPPSLVARGFTRRRKELLKQGEIWIDFFFSVSLRRR